MQVSIGGQYQGVCDTETAQKDLEKFKDAIVTATCIPCGKTQQIKKISDFCSNCGGQVWK